MSAQPEELWQLAPLTVAQLPDVLEIERRAYEFPWTEGIFLDCLRVGYSAWVVHSPSGAVIAYALMTMAAGEAHILNLCVDPRYHHQGVGRFLLDHLMRIARGAHLTVVLLEVRQSNHAALALYETAGFVRAGERRNYYPARMGREDAWLLMFALK